MRKTFIVLALSCITVPGFAQWAENRPPDSSPHAIPKQLFRPDNPFNQKVTGAPVDPASADILAGWDGTHMNYDFGNNYGFPWVTVSSDYPCVYITKVAYAAESDMSVCYPIPAEAHTENGWTEQLDRTIDNPDFASHDRHMLIVDPARQFLWEIYQIYHNHTDQPVVKGSITVNPGEYYAASTAFWDMTKVDWQRPEGWTSSDAAGLPVIPGLVQYDETMDVGGPPIDHAYRTTMNFTSSKLHVYPATHHAASCSTCKIAMGMRVRLKESVPITSYGPHCQRVLQALKTYGAIYADNGGQMFISGFNESRWGPYNSPIRNEMFACMQAAQIFLTRDFELIQQGWGKGMVYQTTPAANQVSVHFGADALPANQNCDVKLQTSGGVAITTNSLPSGGSMRDTVFTGLTPSTQYQLAFDCAHVLPEPGVAFPALAFTTLSGVALPSTPGQPNVLLEVSP